MLELEKEKLMGRRLGMRLFLEMYHRLTLTHHLWRSPITPMEVSSTPPIIPLVVSLP